MIRFLAGLALIATPVVAQDIVLDISETQQCLEVVNSDPGADFRQCIGIAANTCMDTNDGGYSTYGMGACLSQELDWWDGQLNYAYQELMAASRQADGLNGDYAPSQAEALRDMQRAWITYRDAKCDFERTQWGGGTGGSPAALSCLMYETATQSNYLFNAGVN